MVELGLEHVADSRIGNENIRGIYGGERRRVSIEVDVIHDLAMLLLDEPTSHLDNFATLKIMKILKSMAEVRGRVAILSIHQPGFRILELFDSIIFSLERIDCSSWASGNVGIQFGFYWASDSSSCEHTQDTWDCGIIGFGTAFTGYVLKH